MGNYALQIKDVEDHNHWKFVHPTTIWAIKKIALFYLKTYKINNPRDKYRLVNLKVEKI